MNGCCDEGRDAVGLLWRELSAAEPSDYLRYRAHSGMPTLSESIQKAVTR